MNDPSLSVNRFSFPARVAVLACLLLLVAIVQPTRAEPRVGSVSAFWEDSLAVVLPSVQDPFTPSLRQTLRSGVPVIVQLEVRFGRTGFVRNERVDVRVEYDVWTGWYRVQTPLSPLAIEEYATVERLFERDLLLLFDPAQIDPDETWGVRVRVGAHIAEGEDGDDSGVEDDLSGITRFLFRLFGSDPGMSDWSELVRLPARGEQP